MKLFYLGAEGDAWSFAQTNRILGASCFHFTNSSSIHKIHHCLQMESLLNSRKLTINPTSHRISSRTTAHSLHWFWSLQTSKRASHHTLEQPACLPAIYFTVLYLPSVLRVKLLEIPAQAAGCQVVLYQQILAHKPKAMTTLPCKTLPHPQTHFTQCTFLPVNLPQGKVEWFSFSPLPPDPAPLY